MARGSLTDVVTLAQLPFDYEPVIDDTDESGYGVRNVLGNRLGNPLWVGAGNCKVTLDVTLVGDAQMNYQLEGFRSLLIPQDDIGAPHPVYINIGDLYVGRWFILLSIKRRVVSLTYAAPLTPYETTLKMSFEELPVGTTYTGTGA